VVTFGNFSSNEVLRELLNYWTAHSEWVYWLDFNDVQQNSTVSPRKLGWLEGGFYGTTPNEHAFCSERPLELQGI